MKRTMSTAVMILLLALYLGGIVEGKPYRPVSINSPTYAADIPDHVILPDTSMLELAGPPRKHPNDRNIIMILYRDSVFGYFDDTTGEEIFPYMELIKKEEGGFHLITLAFINEEVKIEVYEDGGAFRGRASDRLEKFVSNKERLIRRVRR
jgi:hypothetical protein